MKIPFSVTIEGSVTDPVALHRLALRLFIARNVCTQEYAEQCIGAASEPDLAACVREVVEPDPLVEGIELEETSVEILRHLSS